MRSTRTGLATPALIIIVALAFVTAGAYSYTKIRNKGRAADDLIDSARRSLQQSSRPAEEIVADLREARSALITEIDRLDLFNKTSFDPNSAYGKISSLIHADIANSVITKTDDLFKLINQAAIDPTLKASLSEDRQRLLSLIEAWQKTINASSPATQEAVGKAVNAAVVAAEQYLKSLEQAVNNLTPDNSNLTPPQIETQQQVVETVGQVVNNVNQNLDNAQPDPEDIEDLQEQVDELEEELEEAQNPPPPPPGNQNNGNNQNNNNDDGDDTDDQPNDLPPYVPPPPPDTSGQPQLIQGTNPL